MGVTIILLVVSCLLFFLAYIIDKKTYHCDLSMALLSAAVVLTIVTLAAALVLFGTFITAPKELLSYQAKSEMYQQAIDTISQETSPVDKSALYIEIINHNAKIIQERGKSDSFWITGWHSKLWHEVPLVTLPGDISES